MIASPKHGHKETLQGGNDDDNEDEHDSSQSHTPFRAGYTMERRDTSSTARPLTSSSLMSALPGGAGSIRRASAIDPVSAATIARLTGQLVTRRRHSQQGIIAVPPLRLQSSMDSDRSKDVGQSGEGYRHQLCLDCFQQRGEFNRILWDSCEVCDGIEPLDSHYWEVSDSE